MSMYDFPYGKPEYLNEICAVCGAVRGLHNHMNQACPKDINASRDHTEYRKTVFASIKPESQPGEGPVTEGAKAAAKAYAKNHNYGIEDKDLIEAVEAERETSFLAGFSHQQGTGEDRVSDNELYHALWNLGVRVPDQDWLVKQLQNQYTITKKL